MDKHSILENCSIFVGSLKDIQYFRVRDTHMYRCIKSNYIMSWEDIFVVRSYPYQGYYLLSSNTKIWGNIQDIIISLNENKIQVHDHENNFTIYSNDLRGYFRGEIISYIKDIMYFPQIQK